MMIQRTTMAQPSSSFSTSSFTTGCCCWLLALLCLFDSLRRSWPLRAMASTASYTIVSLQAWSCQYYLVDWFLLCRLDGASGQVLVGHECRLAGWRGSQGSGMSRHQKFRIAFS
ncbi:hypothetical protein BRADI_3g15932v3 [Brachypodium distachyon]|uniref:Uncharacterized protein n=1 Tax=Brachypodium distachyon TaxID=15368 RepID=A0A2K2CXD8_BRADI|nr:hypothetical protein BRADI_3g15932v3 [Brachypodium distachyon]